MTDFLEKPVIYNPPRDPYIDVIYRDDDLLVLHKPSGLLHVPGRHPALSDCLQARVQEFYPQASTIHRLDKDTSGVVVMAIHKKAHAYVAGQFEAKTAAKIYVARVWGVMVDPEGEIDWPLGPNRDHLPRQQVDRQGGKSALTRWEVITCESQTTLVRLRPLTGRTHQLRVHMMALGYPILGDELYAPEPALQAATRLQLHAESLFILHPADGRSCCFSVPCPF